MKANKVESIAIVGGGTSAWLTAAYLSKMSPEVSVTVIDKEIGNSIGVGEGAILGFQEFMKSCGFEFNDWFNNIDATYKIGVLFPDWVDKGNTIWHPFFMNTQLDNGEDLLSAWSSNQEYDYKTYGLPLYDVAVNHNGVDSSLLDSYSFHVDCGKLVQFIQQRICDKVKFISSDVISVVRSGDNVTGLTLANGQQITADMFIDCTGFKSLLKVNPKRTSLDGRVFCDTAVCGQIQYVDRYNEMRPYTRSTAVDHGWIWAIPTRSRMGSGIIFNRSITDIEEAKDYFVNFWGKDRVKKENLRVIDWTPFYTEEPWKGNVVSVGMSAGFIEPLESTGIALIIAQIVTFHNIIKGNLWADYDQQIYNLQFKSIFENCVDFVSMHYSKTNRTEKFWEYVKKSYKPSDAILKNAELLAKEPRITRHRNPNHIFSGANWSTWMIQLGYPVGSNDAKTKDERRAFMLKYFNTIEKYRFNWAHHHETEINRMVEYYNYGRR